MFENHPNNDLVNLFLDKFLQIKYTLYMNYYQAGRKYTHRVRIAGFQGREGGEIIFFFFNHIAIDLLRATAEMLQANNLHPIRKDKLREDK